MVGAGLLAVVAGTGMSMYGASKGAKQASAAAEDAAERQQAIAAQQYAANQHAIESANAAIELGQDRMVNAEMGRFNIMAGLGMPGSYESSYEDYIAGLGGASPWLPQYTAGQRAGSLERKTAKGQRQLDKYGAAGGIFKKTSQTVTTPGAGPVNQHGNATDLTTEVTDYKLNPNEYQQKIAATRSGRMVSYMTAQADQLVRQEGPLWEQIKESVHGPIIEGAGMAHQQLLQEIQTMAAKGGTARNRAVQAATELAASQSIARDKQTQLWTSNLELIKFSINNARAQLSFNDQWIGGQAGVRDAFNNMMNHFTDLRVNSIMPEEIGANNKLAAGMSAASGLEMKAGLIRADNTKNMWAMAGGAVSSIGGLMLGKGLGGGAAAGGVGAPKTGIFGTGLGATDLQKGGWDPYRGSQMSPNNNYYSTTFNK